jgi:hypothetical protein
MLNIAVETFRYLLELRGWRGLVHGSVAARDVKIYLEVRDPARSPDIWLEVSLIYSKDPGPYLLGLSTQCRPVASSPPPEVCVVDLDTDSVACHNPHPGALSRGSAREKLRKRLEMAIGNVGHYHGVPSELQEAFPGGRFRPFSQVEVKGRLSSAERLLPHPSWDWDQERVVTAVNRVLASKVSGGCRKGEETRG